jgi:hypothetical protein
MFPVGQYFRRLNPTRAHAIGQSSERIEEGALSALWAAKLAISTDPAIIQEL